MGMVLTVPLPNGLEPNTVICNWKKHWQLPDYVVSSTTIYDAAGHGCPRKAVHANLERQDEHGPFSEVRKILYSPIDATFLRVSSRIFKMFNSVLYKENSFIFRQENEPWSYPRGPYMMPDGRIQSPSVSMPAVDDGLEA